MIPQVTHLDGRPARSVQQGETYIVPTVYGIPIICPSHIDEGTEGKTSKHWHTDNRFGDVERRRCYWSEKEWKRFDMHPQDGVRASIIQDCGEPITFEHMVAQKTDVWPSGGVFSSVCWLYEHYGQSKAKNGLCAHHGTPLVEQNGCLECPAHGLKYTYNGDIVYKPPFFIATQWVDFDSRIREIKAPLRTGKDGIVFEVPGNFDPFPIFRLEDSDGRIIMESKSDYALTEMAQPGGIHTLSISIGAWPSSGMCPQLAPTDPRT